MYKIFIQYSITFPLVQRFFGVDDFLGHTLYKSSFALLLPILVWILKILINAIKSSLKKLF